jgi:single-stranded-DNA-specific exonuclease
MELREWKLRTDRAVQDDEVAMLRQETGLSPLTLKVCLMRGLKTAQAIQEFLYPRFESLTNPMCIRDMEKAVDRLSQARKNKEKIRVFGDYDVDGTTGAALLSWILREFGFEHDVRQPDRFKDGYGLNVKAVEEAVASGAKVLLTVDCGISSFDAAEKARELGIDLIIVDHHQLDAKRGMPPALAVINPQRTDCESQLKQLCGCGLAFYLAMALRMRGRAEGWFAAGAEPNLKQHLDLVVMATAADMVPLIGDNHVLVRQGLEVLKRSKKPGVRALLEAAGLGSKDVSPGHLGFVIGPRINASGRIQSASLALELLTTTDELRATELAHELERLNQERANIQNQIWDEVRARVEKGISEGKFKHGIVVADPSWHEGVVGIVASRVTETFRKPAAVIALREDFGKGSVRSYAGKDVLAALRASAHTLLGFGGHRHAAGLSVALDRVDELAEAFDQALANIAEDADAKPLLIEGSCSIEELDLQTLRELEHLGPFGPGNPEPVFSVRASVRGHRVLKGRHLKLDLVPRPVGAAFSPIAMEAIWFHAAERDELMSEDVLSQEAEWAGVPELNRFRGQVTPTFRVRDRRPLSS